MNPRTDSGWRWVPIRVRFDKQSGSQKGIMERHLTLKRLRMITGTSLNEPVTLSMITNGTEEPTQEEIAGLLKAAASREDRSVNTMTEREPATTRSLRGMIDFHNKWIKEKILIDESAQSR
jgi:hypothetical protein